MITMPYIVLYPVDEAYFRVKIPPSKSHTHRAVIIASLSQESSVIENPLISGDTISSIEGCRLLGADIVFDDKYEKGCCRFIEVKGCHDLRDIEQQRRINAANSGTTLRFLMAVSSLFKGETYITGDKSLRRRPVKSLADALNRLGARVMTSSGYLPVIVRGVLVGGIADVEAISSQFVSSLMIALTQAEKDSRIIAENIRSLPYIYMTEHWLRRAGADIDLSIGVDRLTCEIPGKQELKSFKEIIPGDYSSAAFWIVAGLISGGAEIKGLKKTDIQGDKYIIEILREMGGDVSWRNNILYSQKSELIGIEKNLSGYPDIVPPLAVACCFAEGKSVLRGIGHLRYKESNRLATLTDGLRRAGFSVKYDRDSLIISGSKNLRHRDKISVSEKRLILDSYNDHRIAMALSIVALRSNVPVYIKDAGCVNISYPGFFRGFEGSDVGIKIIE